MTREELTNAVKELAKKAMDSEHPHIARILEMLAFSIEWEIDNMLEIHAGRFIEGVCFMAGFITTRSEGSRNGGIPAKDGGIMAG